VAGPAWVRPAQRYVELRGAFTDHHARVPFVSQLGHRAVVHQKQRGEVGDGAFLSSAREQLDQRGRQANPSPLGRDDNSDICHRRPVSARR
jgi:hypothetical protein